MSCLNNSFDYKVKLLGLLPTSFDFSKDESIGVRFQTVKLRKVNKPSENHHDGQVIVSDAQLLNSTAIAETKIIRHDTPSTATNQEDVSDEEVEVVPSIDPKVKVHDDQDGAGTPLANEVLPKDIFEDVTAEVDKQAVAYDEINQEPCRSEDAHDEKYRTKSESDEPADEPVDEIMEEERSAKFLYKSFSNINQLPDFLSYRLPIMFLSIKADPYFFKVNKIRFKPYGCANEMEFIQIQWPKQLDELYESPYGKYNKGWSGPEFNKWATEESNHVKASFNEKCAPPSTSKAKSSSNGDDASGDSIDSDIDEDSSSSYHAYIHAEIKPKSEHSGHGFSRSTRGFNILITALVGGVWELEEDPENYTCKHLAEMRTVKEETLCENRSTRYKSSQATFYKRIRMLSNYWQCYVAGETNYLVGVNGRVPHDPEEKREIKELRLYDVSTIPSFIKKCGAEQGFRPWSKEILENRLYKSLCVIYDKVIDAPVGKEFMFVKYNEFDPPVHDVDGSITYLLQLIIEGLPTPSQPKLVVNLMKFIRYDRFVQVFEERKFTLEDIPKTEEKEGFLILTFKNKSLAELFLAVVDSFLKHLKKKDKFPPGAGLENLKIKKHFMEKPVAPGGNNTKSWRSGNQQQEQLKPWKNENGQVAPAGDISQSWRSGNRQQQKSNSWNNNWRQEDRARDSGQSWRNSNNQQQQPDPRHIDHDRRQHYSRRMHAPDNKSDSNWRQN